MMLTNVQMLMQIYYTSMGSAAVERKAGKDGRNTSKNGFCCCRMLFIWAAVH